MPKTDLSGPGWLFVPADRPERFAKAAAVSDQLVIDLEDGVREADKERARSLLRRSEFVPARACLRINGLSTAHAERDIELARELGFGSVMVPMAESHQPFAQLADFSVVALVETARGVVESDRIAAHPNVDALALGTADLQLDLGARDTKGTAGVFEDLLAFARATLLFAGRAHHVPVIDSVHATVADDAGLRRAAAIASAYGMDGKLAIHPKQIEIIRGEFAPSETEVAWAATVVSEAESRAAGAFVLDGELVDEVIIRRAESVLARAPDLSTRRHLDPTRICASQALCGRLSHYHGITGDRLRLQTTDSTSLTRRVDRMPQCARLNRMTVRTSDG